MKLDFCPSHIDPRSCTGLEFVFRLIVESLRILHLRLFGFNPGAGLDNLQISVTHGERNYVERVLVAELRGLLGGAGGTEALDRFVTEQGLAKTCTRRAVTEGANDRRDAGYLDCAEAQGCEIYLVDVLIHPCTYLGKEVAQRKQSLPARLPGILLTFDCPEVVAHSPVDSFAQREAQDYVSGGAAGNTSGI